MTEQTNVPECPNKKKWCKEYCDKDGNVFFRGELQPELKGMYEFLEQKPDPEYVEFVANYKKTHPIPEKKTYSQISQEYEAKKNAKETATSTEKEPVKEKEMENNLSPEVQEQLRKQGELIELLAKKLADLENSEVKQTSVQSPTYVIQAEKEERWGEKTDINIPKSDLLEKPASFITFGGGYLIGTYMSKGNFSRNPYKRSCYFQFQGADIRKNGKEDVSLPFSVFTTYSKKEADWLRGSPMYKITIHEKVKDAIDINPEMAAKLSAISNYVNSMSNENLFSKAQAMGIEVSSNTMETKQRLCAILLNEEVKNEENKKNERLQSAAQSLFVNQD